MPREFRIYPDAVYARWIRNFNKLGTQPMSRAAIAEWEVHAEILFDLTQQYAHVDSGDMKRSGDVKFESSSPTSITSIISYGGGRKSDAKPHWKHQFIDYTKYELERDGQHDFFKRAQSAGEKRMAKGALRALEKHIGSERW